MGTINRELLYKKLYIDGLSPYEAAKFFDVSREKIRRNIMNYGLSPREVAITLARREYRELVQNKTKGNIS